MSIGLSKQYAWRMNVRGQYGAIEPVPAVPPAAPPTSLRRTLGRAIVAAVWLGLGGYVVYAFVMKRKEGRKRKAALATEDAARNDNERPRGAR